MDPRVTLAEFVALMDARAEEIRKTQPTLAQLAFIFDRNAKLFNASCMSIRDLTRKP